MTGRHNKVTCLCLLSALFILSCGQKDFSGSNLYSAAGQYRNAAVTPTNTNPPTTSHTKLPLPNIFPTVKQFFNDHHDLLNQTCADPNNNDYLKLFVSQLRQTSGGERWGFNWKRAVVGSLSRDIIDYYYGDPPFEGNAETYVVDIIGDFCGPTMQPAFIDSTVPGGSALWTLQPLQ